MINGETLACAVVFRAVTDYRVTINKYFRFYKMWHDKIERGEDPYLWQYNEMVAELADLRRFFTKQNIYWDALNLDGKSILRRIDEQLERKVKE